MQHTHNVHTGPWGRARPGPRPKKSNVSKSLFGAWARAGPGPMGLYVLCAYVAHMLYIIPIYFIFISYLLHIYFIFPYPCQNYLFHIIGNLVGKSTFCNSILTSIGIWLRIRIWNEDTHTETNTERQCLGSLSVTTNFPFFKGQSTRSK